MLPRRSRYAPCWWRLYFAMPRQPRATMPIFFHYYSFDWYFQRRSCCHMLFYYYRYFLRCFSFVLYAADVIWYVYTMPRDTIFLFIFILSSRTHYVMRLLVADAHFFIYICRLFRHISPIRHARLPTHHMRYERLILLTLCLRRYFVFAIFHDYTPRWYWYWSPCSLIFCHAISRAHAAWFCCSDRRRHVLICLRLRQMLHYFGDVALLDAIICRALRHFSIAAWCCCSCFVIARAMFVIHVDAAALMPAAAMPWCRHILFHDYACCLLSFQIFDAMPPLWLLLLIPFAATICACFRTLMLTIFAP